MFDVGVRKGNIILISTQRVTILIWGYEGTKRWRTPGVGLRIKTNFGKNNEILEETKI